jgi:hypothetical protein
VVLIPDSPPTPSGGPRNDRHGNWLFTVRGDEKLVAVTGDDSPWVDMTSSACRRLPVLLSTRLR